MVSDPFATSYGIGLVASVEMPDDETLNNILTEALRTSKVNLRPIKIEVECDYAMPLEYGTGPSGESTADTPHSIKGAGGRIHENPAIKGIPFSAILKWTYDNKMIARRYGLRTKSDHQSFAFHVAKRIREKGMLAHPFFRPAIYNILDSLPENYFDDYSHSLRTIGEDMVKEMQRILIENESIATEELFNSISVSYVTSDDALYAHSSLGMADSGKLWEMEESQDIRRGMSRESIEVSLDANKAKSNASMNNALKNAKAPDKKKVWEKVRKGYVPNQNGKSRKSKGRKRGSKNR